MEWIEKVKVEKSELDARILRLEGALRAPAGIPAEQLDIMRRQVGYMRAYSSTLKERLEMAGVAHAC